RFSAEGGLGTPFCFLHVRTCLLEPHLSRPTIFRPPQRHCRSKVPWLRPGIGRPFGIIGNPRSEREWSSHLSFTLSAQPLRTLRGEAPLIQLEDRRSIAHRRFDHR